MTTSIFPFHQKLLLFQSFGSPPRSASRSAPQPVASRPLFLERKKVLFRNAEAPFSSSEPRRQHVKAIQPSLLPICHRHENARPNSKRKDCETPQIGKSSAFARVLGRRPTRRSLARGSHAREEPRKCITTQPQSHRRPPPLAPIYPRTPLLLISSPQQPYPGIIP